MKKNLIVVAMFVVFAVGMVGCFATKGDIFGLSMKTTEVGRLTSPAFNKAYTKDDSGFASVFSTVPFPWNFAVQIPILLKNPSSAGDARQEPELSVILYDEKDMPQPRFEVSRRGGIHFTFYGDPELNFFAGSSELRAFLKKGWAVVTLVREGRSWKVFLDGHADPIAEIRMPPGSFSILRGLGVTIPRPYQLQIGAIRVLKLEESSGPSHFRLRGN